MAPAPSRYRMPAEWHRHKRTWVAWPQRLDNWRDGAGPAQRAYADVIKAIGRFEPVIVGANPSQVANAREQLREVIETGRVQVVELPQDDAWLRDTAPTFVLEGSKVVGIDWAFNGWGGDILPSIELEKEIAAKVLEIAGIERVPSDLILEGGSIHVDGEGTLLTTEECLLNPNRNPGLSKAEIEAELAAKLGVTCFIWVPYGLLADEDTNGHVDNCLCFARPGKVLLAWPSTDDPEQLQRSEAALKVLESSTDAKGRRLEVVKVPLPPPLHFEPHEAIEDAGEGAAVREEGARLAGSYINFYLCNGGLIMPAFGGKAAETDAQAKTVLESVFFDREVVQIQSAREILLGGGNIHCITQQQPAVE